MLQVTQDYCSMKMDVVEVGAIVGLVDLNKKRKRILNVNFGCTLLTVKDFPLEGFTPVLNVIGIIPISFFPTTE